MKLSDSTPFAPVAFHARRLLPLLASFVFRRTEGWSTDRARQAKPKGGDLWEAVPGWGSFCDCVESGGAYVAGGGLSRAAQVFHRLDGGRLEAVDLTLRMRMDMS
jgi:hypothetical protein